MLLKSRPLQWQAPITDQSSTLRLKECRVRLDWFIGMRWLWVAASVLGPLLLILWDIPVHFDPRYLFVTAAFLALTNLVYIRAAKSIRGRGLGATEFNTRVLVIVQTLTDFMALSLAAYILGGVETPIAVLYVGEIILVTMFCERSSSLIMTLVAGGFASLPVLLESLGLLPVQSLFGAPYKDALGGNLVFAIAYTLGILGSFLFCWYIIGAITDSLRQREHELEDAYDKLHLLDEEKTQATLRATHELKAPLAAIKSYVYALREGYGGELPNNILRILGRIGERSDLLMQKIADIIHLSNLKTLVVKQQHCQPVDFAAVLAREVAEARVLGMAHNVDIIDHAAGERPRRVCSSEDLLATLVSNLLRNAIFYSYDGGKVEVSLREHDGCVALRVEDYGIGIPKKNLPKVFDEHFRSNNAVRHNPNSTGLGLPIVREITRLYHAKLEISSELGVGTQVSVTFPLIPNNNSGGTDHGQGPDH